MSTNFHLAPPSKIVDGLLAVPIDISAITALFTFDGATQTASADATITYEAGPTAGNPIFDLRQNITQAWLDAAPFPVAQLAHHDFGGVPFTDLRVIESVQAAGSVHTLRVQYSLSIPDSQLGGSYLPALAWAAGPRLTLAFGLSDLNRARYAEAWLPANLPFDQYSIELEIQILNTMAAHSVITNGAVTSLGANHWQISFPARFSSMSPLLEVRASDSLVQETDTTVLPVSGNTVTIEAWKLTTSAVNLTTQINTLKTFLADNENDYGPYVHGSRFVAFFNGSGGMEYEGGTTTSTGALNHEVFHSWFGRGIKPASQADGWWDEGFTTFHDQGANDAVPFDFTDPPILLCSRDPWQRHTPGNSYSDGSTFWQGMASLLGVVNLNAHMEHIYTTHRGNPVSTQMLEETLLCRSGEAQVVDSFHRFVYGLQTPSPAPDLWLRDDPGHTGSDAWGGTFWDSPDLWIRNEDDGGTSHQSPESGQDNWFHARVRNGGAGAATHFVVTFHARGFLGTQFVYPGDFLPCTAATADFDLTPGATRIVKARWPRNLIPPTGSHTCLLTSVIARGDHPVANRHVWESNNLAQKNLVVVNLLPDEFFLLPVVISNYIRRIGGRFLLEVLVPERNEFGISLLHRSKDFFRAARIEVQPFKPPTIEPTKPEEVRLDCGGYAASRAELSTSAAVLRYFATSWQAKLSSNRRATLPVEIPSLSQTVVGLGIAVPAGAQPGQSTRLHLVQRDAETQQIVGGVAVHVGIRKRSS